MILIITVSDDLHALSIQHVLAARGYKNCHVFECDQISAQHHVSWMASSQGMVGKLRMANRCEIDVAEVELIWWRRVQANQELEEPVEDDKQRKLINNDCRGALNGILSSCFNGTWVSDPEATDRACDKVYQLSIARDVGFRIPETLISQSFSEVAAFSERLEGRVIVKPVAGVAGPLLFTQYLGDPTRLHPKSYEVCPAVYQEYIPGTQHIRLNCFGEQSYAASIETSDLDWRPNLNVPIKNWPVPQFLHEQVRAVLDRLGLAMGIIDLKQTPDGEFVWLEVNPQGQFLFLQPLTNVPLADIFADYLLASLPTHTRN
jgi:hypothetical protein